MCGKLNGRNSGSVNDYSRYWLNGSCLASNDSEIYKSLNFGLSELCENITFSAKDVDVSAVAGNVSLNNLD